MKKGLLKMFEEINTTTRSLYRKTKNLSVKVGVHLDSALIPYIFFLTMDKITKVVQYKILWCLIFTNNIILVEVSREKVNC